MRLEHISKLHPPLLRSAALRLRAALVGHALLLLGGLRGLVHRLIEGLAPAGVGRTRACRAGDAGVVDDRRHRPRARGGEVGFRRMHGNSHVEDVVVSGEEMSVRYGFSVGW